LTAAVAFAWTGPAPLRVSTRRHRPAVMDDGLVADVVEDGPPAPLEVIQDMSTDIGQKFGPTAPAHPWAKPWTNLYEQEAVQLVKARSQLLKQPLKDDMANDEIFVSKDSIHILKHGRPVETEACLVGRRGPGGWLAGAGRSSGQPEACPGATRSLLRRAPAGRRPGPARFRRQAPRELRAALLTTHYSPWLHHPPGTTAATCSRTAALRVRTRRRATSSCSASR